MGTGRRSRSLDLLALLTLAPLLWGFGVLEKRDVEVEAGNAALKAGKAEDALAHYDKAVGKLPADAGAHFDRGAALYALSRFDEAGQEFLRATEAKDGALKASAFYNLGNAFFKKDKFKEAAEAYKRTLGLNPADKLAKWNLEIALQKQKDEQKKKDDQKNQDDKNKDKDKDKKDDKQKDKKDDKKDDQQKKDDKKDKSGEQDQKDKQDQKDQKDQPEKPEKPGEQQIDAVLDNLERSSKDLEKERARARAVRRAPPARDW
ncbi:MAG TPA: tetratricopeptide repeat protein [Polyangia bacterium]|nr:tetratricopeptide repeat protein [Polyangia bacterium]